MREEKNTNGHNFEPWLDSEELAKLLKVHPETVKRRARAGEIPGLKFGKLWRFRASALDFYIQKAISGQN